MSSDVSHDGDMSGDFNVDGNVDAHIDALHVDSHAGSLHVDSHADSLHLDSHADTLHLDTHADSLHLDSHADTLHLDTHADSFHLDSEDNFDYSMDNDMNVDGNVGMDTTPTPLMLLISTALLFFGISGILFYYTVPDFLRFLIFILAPIIAYITTELINLAWKKIAKSRYYSISATRNLIGKKGEVVLKVDSRGGVIKILSKTPMKVEKVSVKPLNPEESYEKGEEVYICNVRDGFMLVSQNRSEIMNRSKY